MIEASMMKDKSKTHEKALSLIFNHFSSLGGALPRKKTVTFDEIKNQRTAMELSQFLLFCKQFEIPISSKVQLTVYRKVIEQQH